MCMRTKGHTEEGGTMKKKLTRSQKPRSSLRKKKWTNIVGLSELSLLAPATRPELKMRRLSPADPGCRDRCHTSRIETKMCGQALITPHTMNDPYPSMLIKAQNFK